MILPASDYQACKTIRPAKLLKGLDQFSHNLIGRHRRRKSIQRQWFELAHAIHENSLLFQGLSDYELKNLLKNSQETFRRQKKGYQDQLPDALALIVEAANRSLDMRPFPVQILGAIMIFHGYLAEMATGEGKSLTACLPAILFAWSGKPCHIITANDYLASRDAEEMAPLYRFCSLTTGWVGSEMATAERKHNYLKGIVYTTSKELLADFLRDKLLLGANFQASRRMLKKKLHSSEQALPGIVMRGIDAAIIDEADSVLIDEAVTPLIISQTHENKPLTEAFLTANTFASLLEIELDYQIIERYREIVLTAAGEKKVAQLTASLPGLWQSAARGKELILTALTGKELYRKDQHYVIEDDKVVIVDEFSGRMMPQRTWRQGLHQAVEAREGLPLSDPSETMARLSFQRFFRFFKKLGGMTGTAQEAADELWHIYNLPVLSLPTNRPCIRQQLTNRYHLDNSSKWQAICDEVATCHNSGQPVLIGTRSIAASEQLATLLRQRDIPFLLLNAIKHREEAEIIASAGQRGSVTIATNMAGRGTDIKLGKEVSKLGGLHVIISERNESGRIDRQLVGRCARQGQPGSVRIYSCLEDDILQRYGSKPLSLLLSKKFTAAKTEKQPLFEKALHMAQQSAQRQAFKQRKTVMQTDDWLTDALSFARSDVEQ